MSALITERDRQTGLEQAWHRKTHIVDVVTRDNSMPFEVIESPIHYKIEGIGSDGAPIEEFIEDDEFKCLIASDDNKPVGAPFASTYKPSNIETFWEIIKLGMGATPFTVVSAGSVDNRRKLFASLKVSEGFMVGDRKFSDFITLIDSFDKSTSLQARYSNVCVVCANTFAAVMNSGERIGKAKHTALIELHVKKLIEAIQGFAGTSESYRTLLKNAHNTPCSPDEARAWITGIEGRNSSNYVINNGLRQKSARMMELFAGGNGNEGRTRLDALSAFTDFHSNESSNRQAEGAQYAASEWGTSAASKTLAVSTFEQNWDLYRSKGEQFLSVDKLGADKVVPG